MKVSHNVIENPLWGESTAEVKVGHAHVLSPYPVLTSTDINNAQAFSREFKTNVSYPNEIHESKKFLNKEKISALLSSEQKRKELTEWIDVQIMKARDNAKAKMCFFTPLLTAEVPITSKVIDLIVEVQLDSELSAVNIPDSPILSNGEILDAIDYNIQRVNDVGKETFFLTKTSYDELSFAKRLRMSMEKMNGVTALYSNPTVYSQNFGALALAKQDDFLRFMSNVERRYPRTGKWMVTPLAMLCSDIFSSKLSGGGGKQDVTKEQTNARRLNQNCLGHLTLAEHENDFHQELDCECPVDRGNQLADLPIDYKGHLNEAFRTHEPFALFEAVDEARDKIAVGKLPEFINGKKYTKEAYNVLFKPAQYPLIV